MNPFVLRITLFLFASGFCALVYQIAWLRMLRLVFGSSTPASAAVLGIFMGGLGLGGWILGRRVDRTANPLKLYANLELGISIAAALSVPLIMGVRAIYIGIGGTQEIGLVAGSVVRLLLAAAVLAVPTFLMGGTLPAMVRAITRERDSGRHTVGHLYAFNTLGAVLGAVVTTFVLLELVGIRQSIFLAALVNVLIAMAARSTARQRGMLEPDEPQTAEAGHAAVEKEAATPRALYHLVLSGAVVVGFVFFLMELVWYRMMAPILGGSTYTFGIILMVALFGIGAGGWLYSVTASRFRPGPLHFAGTCMLEALCLVVPFALGDYIALIAHQLRGLQAAGFFGLAISWTVVTSLVVLPAALVAGYQFPVLVAVLGSGRRRIGREVGLTYAWNTVGAIAGSIAGGFGLLPLLSAPTTWRLSIWLLVALAGLFLLYGVRVEGLRKAIPATVVGVLALFLSTSTGPTAFWRHSGIGAGRLRADAADPIAIRDLRHARQRGVAWETDGRESSVALVDMAGYSFFVNGKSDGSARGDAPTQVMSGLIGAVLHPEPKQALVIGLGTGSSAGWLAEVPSIEGVDVVELEPAIRAVAEACSPVNHDVLNHPKVNLIIADGRELLLTSGRKYDIIFSEPSNPYRAGISSLFTREFYEAAARGLEEGGILIQWLQAYEIDAQVVRTAYATLGTVFPNVETWQVQSSDLLLLASQRPLEHDLERIAGKVMEKPFVTAMNAVWGVTGLEGFYTGYVASPRFARAVQEQEGDAINTDDHPIIEFGFARHVGRSGTFKIDRLRELARFRNEDIPLSMTGSLDWDRVVELREARNLMFDVGVAVGEYEDPERLARNMARAAYFSKDLPSAYDHWISQTRLPTVRMDLLLVAESMAEAGDPVAEAFAERLSTVQPVEAAMVMARLRLRQGDLEAATDELSRAFRLYREDPWPWKTFMQRSFSLVQEIAKERPKDLGRRLFDDLEEPFAVHLLDQARLTVRNSLVRGIDFEGLCVGTYEDFEPWVPWKEGFLRGRRDCYEGAGHPLARTAQKELERFLDQGEVQMWWGLLPEEKMKAPEPELWDVPDDSLGRG